MDNHTETAPAEAVLDFTSSDLESADTADMYVVINGKPTTWRWTFSGPGHPKAVEQSNRVAREALQREADQEQARVNGRKYKAPHRTPDEVRNGNVDFVVERIIGWSPVRLDGADLPFSPEAARKLLLDPRKSGILQQAIDFLADDKAFTKRSAISS